jgi:hypothetical protein
MDLEALCTDLWQAEFGSLTQQRHGRSGQIQFGVDISGYDKQSSLVGIQCKCIGSNSLLTEEQIDAEVQKAKTFRPKLSHYILVTTGLKDAKLENFCREITQAHLGKKPKLFTVTYYGWEDVCLMMQRHSLVARAHFPFAIFSKKPLILNNETSQDWKTLPFSFTRPEYIHPRIVEELQGYMSDRYHTVISVDLTAANHSNRFFGAFETEIRNGEMWIGHSSNNSFFRYNHIAVSASGIHIVQTADWGGGSGVFCRLLFLVLQKDIGLVQDGYEVSSKERVLLKILGSLSLGRDVGTVSYARGVLKIGSGMKTKDSLYSGKAFSIRIS